MKQEIPLLGAHLSISEGFTPMIAHAESLGCTAIQFFSKSNRQWHVKPLCINEVNIFKQTLKNSSIRSVTVHASYLINLASPNKENRDKASLALKDELIRAQQLEADFLVLHPGSHKETSIYDSLIQAANCINTILDQTEHGKTKLLLETMAGQGSTVGRTFQELAYIYDKIEKKERVGICLDTCHIFAAGYNIRSQEGYETTIRSFKDILGLEQLGVIHINDSKTPLGSHIDRHEHIGQGHIGLNTFTYIINDKRLKHVPKILETPLDHPDDHARNLQILKNLIIK